MDFVRGMIAASFVFDGCDGGKIAASYRLGNISETDPQISPQSLKGTLRIASLNIPDANLGWCHAYQMDDGHLGRWHWMGSWHWMRYNTTINFGVANGKYSIMAVYDLFIYALAV